MESTKAGIICSTFMVLLFAIDPEELVSTIILGAIGASVSFGISFVLERVFKKKRTK